MVHSISFCCCYFLIISFSLDLKNLTSFNESEHTGQLPITIADNFTLVDVNIDCGGGSGTANLNIDVDTNIAAQVEFGYTFIGSIVPLDLSDVCTFYPYNRCSLSDAT